MSEWDFVKLGSLAHFKNGLNFSKDSWGKGIKIIGVSDFKDYLYPRYETLAEINPNGVVRKGNYLEEDDILFVRSNGNRLLISRSLNIKTLTDKVSHSGFTIRLRFTSSSVYVPFYVHLLRSSLIRSTLSLHGGGTNINNLNQEILSDLAVPVPQLSTQKRIAAVLSAYDDPTKITIDASLYSKKRQRKSTANGLSVCASHDTSKPRFTKVSPKVGKLKI